MAAFRAQHEGNADETKRRYKRILRHFTEFCAREALTYVDQINLEAMDLYARSRIAIKSWTKDVELLRQFFEFCRDRYERRRARAMTLLMRYAGLRISDVVTLARKHIQGRYLVKRAVKNNKVIRVELPSSVLEALEVLPLPKAAAKDNQRFFSSDTTGLRSLVKGAWRTMDAVFKRSGVAGAHRFRHTLARELLGKDGSIEKVAGILRDSPATIRRYYTKWTPEFQTLQDDLIRKIHGTHLAQAGKETRTH